MLVYISLPNWRIVYILYTMLYRERFSVFRVEHRVQKHDHVYSKPSTNPNNEI